MLQGTYPFFEEGEDYISYIMPDDLNKITKRLNKVNIYEKTLHITAEILSENNIYPENFSDYKEEHDMILREELRDNFNKLKIFFNRAEKDNNGVILALL